jgi:DNA-directed RNA polymerase specialized sigma24 family protein
MVGSDPCASASWALAPHLMQADVPPQGYAPLPADKDRPGSDHRRSNQCLADRRSRAALPVRRSSLTARDGFRSQFSVTRSAPTAWQPAAAGTLNRGSSPGTNQQLRSLMADAMRQLPFEYRAVIYRAYYQGWTTERIADDLKITEAAVKSRLHDGLHILRLTFHRMGRRR